jgi:MoxR-like ATPase
MEEGQVTVEGETHDLADPFFVLATQNPVEQEGTFPLPEAQVDRFLIKTGVGYPDRDGEERLLDRRLERTTKAPSADRVLTVDEVRALQAVPERVHVDDDIRDYILDVARGTRDDHRVETGVSPRGTQKLLETARSMAVLKGRDYVNPDDVKRVAEPTLAHRLLLTPNATMNDTAPEAVVADILDAAPVPKLTA